MNYLDYILPPLLGAGIGYITNAIAIKMLFKPYRAWRIFGVRVPFTPGVIPRHREELAINIGKMVGTILLNEESLQKQLTSPNSHRILESVLSKNIDEILDYDCPPLKKLIPTAFHDSFDKLYRLIKENINNMMSRYIMSEDFSDFVRRIVGSNMDAIEERKLGELVSLDEAEKLSGTLIPDLVISLSEKGITEGWIESLLDKMRSSTRKLGDFIPGELVTMLSQWVEGELPELLGRLEKAVFDSELDKKLHGRFRKVILDYLESLNRVQKFIVNVWGVEERVDEDLPVVIEEAIRQVFRNLSEDESRKELMKALNQSLDKMMEREIAELFERVEESEFDELKNNALGKVKGYLTTGNIKEKLGEGIMRLYESHKDKKIGELLPGNQRSSSPVGDYISGYIVKSLRKKTTQDELFRFVEQKMDHWVETKDIGRLRDSLNLGGSDMKRVSSFLSQYLLNLIHKDISYVVEAVNVRQVVTDKINQFPLEKVENIVLSIIQKHLKWINVFGGIIGAAIGLMQVIYMMMR